MPQELQIPSELDLAAFIAREAHDLKSPFNRVIGFLKLVLKGLDGPISEQAQDDLNIVYLNTQYALAMTNALVDIARLGRGERSPTIEGISVDAVLQQTISEWTRKYYKENSVEISVSTPKLQIQADEIMMRQCVAYWLSYVNEFAQDAVTIKIEVEEGEGNCLFTIRSSGTKHQAPPECDLTLHGFVAQGLLEVQQGEVLQLEEHDEGALVRFSLPKAD